MEQAHKRDLAEYQSNVADFVRREVYFCASYLVSELAQNEKYMDDLLPVCVQDDWRNPAYEYASQLEKDGELTDLREALDYADAETPQDLLDDDDKAREFCDFCRLDAEQNEALEHWIVSGWLADKLESKGEMVIRDFLGLTIWGRTCSGQGIASDCVICDIYNELHK